MILRGSRSSASPSRRSARPGRRPSRTAAGGAAGRRSRDERRGAGGSACSVGGRGGAAVAAEAVRAAGRSPGVARPRRPWRRRARGTGSPRLAPGRPAPWERAWPAARPAWRPACRAWPPAWRPALPGLDGRWRRPAFRAWPPALRPACAGGVVPGAAARAPERRRASPRERAAPSRSPPAGRRVCGPQRLGHHAPLGLRRGGPRGLGGLRGDALLELLRALGRSARPLAQALDLSRLGEVEQRQDRKGRDRGEACVGSVLLDLARQREGEDLQHEPMQSRWTL